MKVKISKFTVAVSLVLVILIATICAVGLVWSDIQKLKAVLDNLYWIEEHTHSVPAGMMIEWVEAKLLLRQSVLALLTLLIVTCVLVLLMCLYYLKRRVKT